MLDRTRTVAVVVSLCLLSAHAVANAQSYDPRTDSLERLLSAPKDPLAYYDAKARVRVMLERTQAAEAEPLAEQITREYPRDGENWLLLAEVKRALKKYPDAAAAYEKAGELLWWGGPASPAASGATMHLLAGNKRAALDLLRHYTLVEGNMDRSWIYEDEDFVSLRADPEFLEIAGRPDTTGCSRDYGWRRDVDFLRSEVKRLNADYRTSPLPPEFERRYEELKEKVPRLSDEEIFVGMNRMLAVLRQGHTAISTRNDSRVASRALPFQLWAFPEGIFIVGAAEQHKDLIGSRLVAIADVPAEEALRRLNEVQSVDGDNEFLFEGVNRLRAIPYLAGLGIVKSGETIPVTVQRPNGPARNITVGTPPFEAPGKLVPPPSVETPLFLQDTEQFHWDKALPKHDALYVQLNGVANDKDETLAQYALRLRALFAEAAPKNVILDMRQNNGGSTHLYAEFLRTMIAFTTLPDRRLYVLIGRRTYSAAANLATELEQLANAIFVGEATGECCTFYASPARFTLPFSKLGGRQSTKRWSLSRKGHDFRRELNPHLPVVLTAKDYFAGRDPVIETVLRMIERDAQPAPASAN